MAYYHGPTGALNPLAGTCGGRYERRWSFRGRRTSLRSYILQSVLTYIVSLAPKRQKWEARDASTAYYQCLIGALNPLGDRRADLRTVLSGCFSADSSWGITASWSSFWVIDPVEDLMKNTTVTARRTRSIDERTTAWRYEWIFSSIGVSYAGTDHITVIWRA
ncbi:MAG: hypothetical protein LBG24_04345 [Treponema sp.]|nr:hypothetical protein [Treponema sp.]